MAPMTIYHNKTKYFRKVNGLKKEYPKVIFTLPHNAFMDANDWLANIDEKISNVNCGVLLTDKGIIGRGCYIEVGKLKEEGKPVYLYYKRKLIEQFVINLLPENAWVRYAKVEVALL